jgi:hypothetical protein
MSLLGLSLMLVGLIVGLVSIFKTMNQSISPVKLGWFCYSGVFVALFGAMLI